APSHFAAEWIEDKYGALLLALTRRILGEHFHLSVEERADGRPAQPLDALPSADLQEIGAREQAAAGATPAPAAAVI
ncbi:MAG: hypothetical protein GTO05_05175, partial [Gemmatimonadales bacterium]|nr:hypothetical protein [Gemmatimonadales bacterium]